MMWHFVKISSGGKSRQRKVILYLFPKGLVWSECKQPRLELKLGLPLPFFVLIAITSPWTSLKNVADKLLYTQIFEFALYSHFFFFAYSFFLNYVFWISINIYRDTVLRIKFIKFISYFCVCFPVFMQSKKNTEKCFYEFFNSLTWV